jgi:hypothetical protein
MTRGKLLFMFAGLCVVAILLWIASMMQKPGPLINNQTATTMPAGNEAPGVTGDFYITGHVNHGGMLTLHEGEKISDAVRDAGGADSAVNDLVVRLVRKDGQNTSTRSIPLAGVMSGETDEKLQRGDIITIVQQAKPATVQIPPMRGSGSNAPTPPAGSMP